MSARAVVWIVLFWASTYAVFSVRGRLLADVTLDWIDALRILAVSASALFYGVAIILQDRLTRTTPALRTAAALATAAVGGASLFCIRLAAGDGDWSDATSRESELRWLITWLGYFLAWVAFYVVGVMAGEGHASGAGEAVAAPDAEIDADTGADHIWVQRGQQRVRVPVAAIEYVEAEGNYASLHSEGGHGIVRIPLARLEGRLGAAFVRVHRSIICRRSALHAIERAPSGAFRATLASGAIIPIGRRTGAALLEEMRSGAAGPDA